MAQRDDVLALGVELRQQYSGFVSLRAAIGKKRFLQPPGSNLRQLLRQANLRLVGIKRREMLHLVGLLIDRLRYFLVAMPDAHREDAAEEIQELLAVGIVNILIFGMIDDQRFVVIGCHAREQIFFLLLEDFVFVHTFPHPLTFIPALTRGIFFIRRGFQTTSVRTTYRPPYCK